MSAPVDAVQAIRRCMDGCLRSQDGRGVWRKRRALVDSLVAQGSSRAIAERTAEAAVTVALSIKGRG